MTAGDLLTTVARWAAATPRERAEALAEVGARLGLEPDGTTARGGGKVPVGSLRHAASGVVFRLIPGGTFLMGMSDAERQALSGVLADGQAWEAAYDAADEAGDPLPDVPGHYIDASILASFLSGAVTAMSPAHQVHVKPFLVGSHPLSASEARTWLPDFAAIHYLRRTDLGPDQVGEFDTDQGAALRQRWPFRLLTEAEWEYAVRAESTSLCYRGGFSDLPAEGALVTNFADPAVNERDENAFGLHGIGPVAEICADVYVDGYVGAPSDGSARVGDGLPVLRAGMMRPSQGCNEWLSLLSATRFAHESSRYALRSALSL